MKNWFFAPKFLRHLVCAGMFLPLLMVTTARPSIAEESGPEVLTGPSVAATLNGKYTGLLQSFECPSDIDAIGPLLDLGYYEGVWCDQTGVEGYWVYSYPTWYIWEKLQSATAPSADFKYGFLMVSVECPEAAAEQGSFMDVGFAKEGELCGAMVPTGYRVYAGDNWYIWHRLNDPDVLSLEGQYGDLQQAVYCPAALEEHGPVYQAGEMEGPVCESESAPGYRVYMYPYWYTWGERS